MIFLAQAIQPFAWIEDRISR